MSVSKRRLRREHRALLRHPALLCGLILLTELGLEEQDATEGELGITNLEGRETLSAFRNLLQTKYTPKDTKARMLFDEFQEIDLYVTGPFKLFFTLAQAMVERYWKLKAKDPTLCHPDFDRCLITDAPGFDAVKNLRDWLTHPGISRRTDEAVSTFWDEDVNTVRPDTVPISARS